MAGGRVSRRVLLLGFLAALSLLVTQHAAVGVSALEESPIIAVAGDIACDPNSPYYNNGLGDAENCAQQRTSDLLLAGSYAAVLPLGDLQYESATLARLMAVYDPSWGRVKTVTRPAIGNHEYQQGANGRGYFTYFNGQGQPDGPAGPTNKGYYSFDVGEWHLIALNSNCRRLNEVIDGRTVGGCAARSSQMNWLTQDLAGSDARCTLAYWHHPRFSSSDPKARPMGLAWNKLYNEGAELVLNGHSHNYQRYAPQSPSGMARPSVGIREIVVGTGGKSHHSFESNAMLPNEEVRDATTFGVLELELAPTGYTWTFKPDPLGPVGDNGFLFADAGSDECH